MSTRTHQRATSTLRLSRLRLCVALCALMLQSAALASHPTYEDDVKPIFREHCFNCHNPDKRKADLDLTSFNALSAGSSSGPIVESAKPDDSTLYLVLTHQEDPTMPPKKPKIPDAQINLIKQWIVDGMPQTLRLNYEQHVKPIFDQYCLDCHNTDKKKADLLLNSYAGVMSGSSSGTVIEPGNPDESNLFLSVTHQQDPFMPKDRDKLSDKDLRTIEQWIRDGALENANSKPRPMKKSTVQLAMTSAPIGQPTGPVAVPDVLLMDPVVHTPRADVIDAMAHSPWAPVLAIGGQKQIVLYNSQSMDYFGVIPFDAGFPRVLRFTHNGDYLLAAGGIGADHGSASLYSVRDGRRITAVGDEFDAVLAADINAQQTIIAIGGPNRLVKVFNTDTGAMRYQIKKHTDWVLALAFSPDGVLLVSGDRNGGLHVWEAYTGELFYDLRGHKNAITALAWRDDSNVLASASEDGTVKLWNMSNGTIIKSINAHNGGVLDVRFTHDGRLVTAGRDRKVKIFKPDGNPLRELPPLPDIVTRATFNHDGSRLITGDFTGAVRIYDAQTGKPIGDLSANPPTLASRLDNAEKYLHDLQAQLASLNITLHAADARAKQAADALAQAQTRHDQLDKTLQQNEPRIKALREKIKPLQHQRNQFALPFDKLQKRLTEKQQRIDQLIAQSTAQQKSLDAANADLTKYRDAVESAEKDASSTDKQRADESRKQHPQAQRDLQHAEQNIQQLTRRIQRIQSQQQQATDLLKQFQQQRTDQQYKLAKVDKQLAPLNQQYEKLEKSLTVARNDFNKLNTALPQLKQQAEQAAGVRDKAHALTAQIADAQQHVHKYHVAEIYARLYHARLALHDSEQHRTEARRAFDGSQAANDSAVTDASNAQNTIKTTPGLIQQRQNDLNQLRAVDPADPEKIKAAEAALADARKQSEQAPKQLALAQSNVDRTQKESDDLQARVDQAERDVAAARAIVDKLAAEYAAAAK